jgi:ABC-2 type transport system ATP-binding protein
MLQAQDLWKSYGNRNAVSGVSLELKAGEIVGLLGPNGAGKSTTVAMLCGLTHPDRGVVTLGGEPVGDEASAAKRRIGLVPQDIALYEDLSAVSNVELFGALYGVAGPVLRERARAALELVGLSERAKDKPQTFSGGMKRRLNIACALVHDPGRAAAGRAHGRRRSAEPQRHFRQSRDAALARQGAPLYDPLHGGG